MCFFNLLLVNTLLPSPTKIFETWSTVSLKLTSILQEVILVFRLLPLRFPVRSGGGRAIFVPRSVATTNSKMSHYFYMAFENNFI